jgi:hypothetical protein
MMGADHQGLLDMAAQTDPIEEIRQGLADVKADCVWRGGFWTSSKPFTAYLVNIVARAVTESKFKDRGCQSRATNSGYCRTACNRNEYPAPMK